MSIKLCPGVRAQFFWQWWISKLIWFPFAGQYFLLGWQVFWTGCSFFWLLFPFSFCTINTSTECPKNGRVSWLLVTHGGWAGGSGGCPEQSCRLQPWPQEPQHPQAASAPLSHVAVLKAPLHRTRLKPLCVHPLVAYQHRLHWLF